jgi:hypothetical protein
LQCMTLAVCLDRKLIAGSLSKKQLGLQFLDQRPLYGQSWLDDG